MAKGQGGGRGYGEDGDLHPDAYCHLADLRPTGDSIRQAAGLVDDGGCGRREGVVGAVPP